MSQGSKWFPSHSSISHCRLRFLTCRHLLRCTVLLPSQSSFLLKLALRMRMERHSASKALPRSREPLGPWTSAMPNCQGVLLRAEPFAYASYQHSERGHGLFGSSPGAASYDIKSCAESQKSTPATASGSESSIVIQGHYCLRSHLSLLQQPR